MATMDPLSELSRMAGTSVPGLGGSESIPRNRSFKELQTASEAMGTNNTTPSTALPSQTTNPFLTDLPTLRSTTFDESKQSSVEESQARTPEDRIDSHFQRLFSQQMKSQQEETRRIVDDLYEKRVQEAHDARMKKFVAELHGDRTLGGSSQKPLAYSTGVATSVKTQEDLDPAIVAPYLDVVYRWNRNHQVATDQVLYAFQNLAQSAADVCAWKLVGSIVARSDVGALSFYCHQFQQIVRARVRDATADGQDISTPYSLSNGMAQVVASYVKLTTNITSSPWPIIYYCLRCGDPVAALDVMNATHTPVDPALRQMLSALGKAQGNLSCVWDTPVPPGISQQVRQGVAAFYDRTKHLDTADSYHVAALALLSAADLNEVLASPVVKTTEDYLYGGLWYALNQPYPPTAINELANTIKQLGPDSFTQDSEWGYAFPLLAAQQYREALMYVAKTNLLQATHVAMMLDAAKVDLNDAGSTTQSVPLVTTFLLEYANLLQQKDAFAAAEYLVRIPNEVRAQTEVARVVVESQQADDFAPRLQELFPDTAPTVLVEAAEQARTRGKSDLAARLYWSSERFDLLFSLLNDQLASEIANGTDEIEWRNKALAFHRENLADSKGLHIQRFLEDTGTQDRLETFLMLLEVNRAFSFMTNHDYVRAWESIDSLPLLPSSDSECASKASQYSSWNPAIKKVFPMVLEKSMECLSQIYAQHSASYGPTSGQDQKQRLRSTAQMLLFQFTGELLANLPKGTITRMESMEKKMM